MWRHLKECGMDEDISLIAKHFSISELNVFTPQNGGKLTYIENRLPKHHRICVATKSDQTVKDVILDAKEVKKRWKK